MMTENRDEGAEDKKHKKMSLSNYYKDKGHGRWRGYEWVRGGEEVRGKKCESGRTEGKKLRENRTEGK